MREANHQGFTGAHLSRLHVFDKGQQLFSLALRQHRWLDSHKRGGHRQMVRWASERWKPSSRRGGIRLQSGPMITQLESPGCVKDVVQPPLNTWA